MKWVLAVVFGLVVAACGSSGGGSTETTTTVEPIIPYVVVTVVQDGGCMMMGPNCPTYEISSDGSVALYRSGAEQVDQSTIDTALVDAIVAESAGTDLDALRQRLPQGECQGCYDGIDTTFVYQEATFSGVDVELVASEPLFAATWDAVAAAGQVLILPVEERS
jgi:hypothetical protein